MQVLLGAAASFALCMLHGQAHHLHCRHAIGMYPLLPLADMRCKIDDFEWSFGFCERGTGVYCVHAKTNPMYQYRETVSLGATTKIKQEVGLVPGQRKHAARGVVHVVGLCRVDGRRQPLPVLTSWLWSAAPHLQTCMQAHHAVKCLPGTRRVHVPRQKRSTPACLHACLHDSSRLTSSTCRSR